MQNSWMPSKKEIRWLASGLIAGATVGLVFGVAISGIQSSKTENSYDQSRLSAQSLGWSSLNEVYDTSKAYSASYDKTLYSEILSALRERYSFASKNKPAPKPGNATTSQPKTSATLNKTSAFSVSPTFANQSEGSAYLDGKGPIDINTASVKQIDDVPRMGTQTAKDIWNYIKSRGPIKSFDELDQVKGVGEKTIEKLRSLFHIGK